MIKDPLLAALANKGYAHRAWSVQITGEPVTEVRSGEVQSEEVLEDLVLQMRAWATSMQVGTPSRAEKPIALQFVYASVYAQAQSARPRCQLRHSVTRGWSHSVLL